MEVVVPSPQSAEQSDATVHGRIVPAIVVAAILGGFAALRLYDYLLFHCIVEIFTATVAFGVFVVAWNSRRFSTNGPVLVLGVGFFFVGVLTVLHALAYEGMGVFHTAGANLATQLWVAARWVQASAFLAAVLSSGGTPRPHRLIVGFGGLTAVLLASIFVFPVFPRCFVEGRGLTGFKIGAEYVVVAALLASLALLGRVRPLLERRARMLLAWGLATLAIAEIGFTLYHDVYGLANLLGHLLYLTGSIFVYRAVVETALQRPYGLLFRDLKRSEQALQRDRDLLREANEKLERLSREDALTGLANRRAIREVVEARWQTWQRYRSPFALVMIDVDDFKSVNDQHGHTVGDRTLRALAERLRDSLRTTDALGRFGGEEFLAVLPEATPDGALAVAEKLVLTARQPTLADPPVGVTVSVGVAVVNAADVDVEALIHRADAAMYAAKRAGKSRAALAPAPSHHSGAEGGGR